MSDDDVAEEVPEGKCPKCWRGERQPEHPCPLGIPPCWCCAACVKACGEAVIRCEA